MRSTPKRPKKSTHARPRDRATRTVAQSNGIEPLPVESLRWRCDPTRLGFESTKDVEPVTGIVGQDTAVEALRFGIQTNAPGQNVFVRGLSGTGRLTMVQRLLAQDRHKCPATKDCCYVHNFSQPERPRLITLPAGQGQGFRRRVDKLVDFIRDDLSAALSSEEINARRSAWDEAASKRLNEVVGPFEEALRQAGFTLVSVEAGSVSQAAIFPLVDGKAVPPEQYEQLHAQGEITDIEYKSAREKYTEFERQLVGVNEKADAIRAERDEAIGKLLEQAARSVLARIVRDIQAAFPQSSVQSFLCELVDDVVKFRLGGIEEGVDFTRLYRTNVVLEHKADAGCPVIVENTPTLRNLVGTIEPDFEGGDEIRATHMGIRAGSLLRADGGFLIFEDRDILDEPDAWKVLKRALRTGRLEILSPEAAMPGWAPALKPEPIEISVKVILVGEPDAYAMLDEHDRDFPQLFKVLADFDDVITRDSAGIGHYAAVLARIAREEQLPPFDSTAVAALTEYGARIAAAGGKLTARFGRLADVAREAAFITRKRKPERSDAPVTGDDVREAVARGKERANLPSRRFRELVTDGTIRVDTKGMVVGQVNGLAVMQAGPMVYGFPTRITATIGPGTAGVINIDREAALSGAIHTKGFYILGGLLRYLLRTDHPLAFDASVAFEQSYGEIDGDSASGAEMCCLLSALTDIALRQDIAMTGAIDQMGHILAVGAVDEKVEGFFDVCNELGLTGTQGVVIPRSNAGDLMLRQDVVAAAAAGQFHVYAIDTLHEALELLTGIPAGVRSASGKYPKGSLLGIALERARRYWRQAAQSSPSPRSRSKR